MKVVRKIIQIDEELCDGCGKCADACPSLALALMGISFFKMCGAVSG